jgi:acylphosphatase
MTNNQRVHLWITGRVQGVFFRMETLRAAKRIGVSGWVRNLPDGRVEVVLEGPAENVNDMTDWCRKGPPMARVTDLEKVEETPSGEFADFSIR